MVSSRAVKRIHILGVPVDILPEEDFEDIIRDFFLDKVHHQIIFLSFDGLLKARRNNDFAKAVASASLVIPISRKIVKTAEFLNIGEPVRYMPFNFVIKLLGVLEKYHKTLYLAGMKPAFLQNVSGNLRSSFPGLGIVGRCAGYFKSDVEKDIILAIKKASPSLLLCGGGIPGKNVWLYRNLKEFNPGLFLWCGECFDIFAGKKDRLSNKKWESSFYWIVKAFKRPWHIWKIFPYTLFHILILVEKIRK